MAVTPLDRLLEYKMHLLTDSRQPRVFAAWWQDLITAAFAAWFFGGLILDVNAHARNWAESFFTWWHLAFYTGYFATAAWIAWICVRAHRADGRTGMAAVPHGYGPAMIGIPLFLVSGVADMVWHEVLGVETSLAILFSPSHLGLAAGGILIVAAPWLSAWRREALAAEPEPVPFEARMAAPALSLGFVVTALVLFLAYLVPYTNSPFAVAAALQGPHAFDGLPLAGIVATTVLVLALAVLATGRFRLPLGFFTVAFVYPSIMAGAYAGFAYGGYVWVFLLSGVWLDFLVWLVRPELRRRRDLLVLAGAWAVPVWAAFLIATGSATDAWPAVEIGLGAPIVAAAVGGLFMLVVQPERREVVRQAPVEPSPFDDVIARAKAMTENR
ncbi:hypothetical protein K3N28_04400 [Glycomyces sp. TRM65418]|uniref:hypothetical protein n=1 Tax=Glycomyces sp. TRM65418 TaxID=2867006 RepID=UPI001CE4B780|nr:hypothetical protein [Glycomyces sp. TRM65418]MCC3762309.1 hypothetical protein [Glycomyces sp. TRM65418]QZD56363.1 hypothetical protein K3N28_04370 [Glycomyces sp. TRM65418]